MYRSTYSSGKDQSKKISEQVKIRYKSGRDQVQIKVKKFKKSHPHLKFGESTRSLSERHHDKCKSSDHSTVIQKKQIGRLLMTRKYKNV